MRTLAAATLAVLLCSAVGVRGEPIHGSIAGLVTDASRAPAADVTVTVTSEERGLTLSVKSDSAGAYAATHLLPGRYGVRAERNGFKTCVAFGVTVDADAETRLDLTLELGPRHEEVQVSSTERPLLRLDRAEAAVTLDGRDVTRLPLLDRNFARLLLLTPGVQQLPWQHASSENPQGSIQAMIQGQHFGGTGFVLDGVDNHDPILGIIVINPTLESVEEAKVTTQGFDMELGLGTAGVLAVTTRSGTNTLSGSLFDFARDDRFQARNPFTQPPGEPLPDDRRQRFGGAVGGPLHRDRWFFFGDYEGSRSTLGGSRLLTVPTARARTGDLGEYGVTVFDPETGPPERRTAFPGSVIPAPRIVPSATRLLDLLPLPNRPGLEDNYLASGSERFDSDAFNVRLDGQTGVWKTFARYSLADYRRVGPAAFGPGGGPEIVTLGGRATGRNQGLAVGTDAVLGPQASLDVRFGYFRYNVRVLGADYGTAAADALGLPGLNVDRDSSGLPSIFVEGPYGVTFGSGHASGCNCPLLEDETQLQLAAGFTRLMGSHTLKVGADWRRAHNLRIASDANRSGELTFSENRTRGAEGGGLGLAALLLGDVTAFRRYVSSTTDARERQWRHSYYAQDTWKASRRVTVNVGLRADVIQPQSVNAPGHGGWLDLATGQIRVGGVGDIGLDGNVRGGVHLAPRIAASYRLGAQTVLRAGYGRNYDVGVFGSTFGHTVTQNLPVLAVQDLSAPENFERVFDLRSGPPAAEFPAVPADGRLPLPPGVYAQALPDRVRLPTVDAWNVSLEHEVTATLSLEAAYLGSTGTRGLVGDGASANVNEPTLAGFPDVPTDLRRPFFAGPVAGIGGAFGWTQAIDFLCSCGDRRYDALVVRVARRTAGGLSFLAHYTLQRAWQDGPSQFFLDRSLDRGRPDWARTHNLAVASVADVPVGRGRRLLGRIPMALDRVLGGWSVAWTAVVQSGLPFDVTYRDAGADRDVGPNRPDLVGDPAAGRGDGLRSPYFNALPVGAPGSAFARPAVGTFGNVRRNALTGPGYWRVDATLFKHIPVKRRWSLELSAQVFNLFNHVNLGNPDAEIGVPGNPNPAAGFITSTAYSGTESQRNLQFGVRLSF